jgi:hypothetical protein
VVEQFALAVLDLGFDDVARPTVTPASCEQGPTLVCGIFVVVRWWHRQPSRRQPVACVGRLPVRLKAGQELDVGELEQLAAEVARDKSRLLSVGDAEAERATRVGEHGLSYVVGGQLTQTLYGEDDADAELAGFIQQFRDGAGEEPGSLINEDNVRRGAAIAGTPPRRLAQKEEK